MKKGDPVIRDCDGILWVYSGRGTQFLYWDKLEKIGDNRYTVNMYPHEYTQVPEGLIKAEMILRKGWFFDKYGKRTEFYTYEVGEGRIIVHDTFDDNHLIEDCHLEPPKPKSVLDKLEEWLEKPRHVTISISYILAKIKELRESEVRE